MELDSLILFPSAKSRVSIPDKTSRKLPALGRDPVCIKLRAKSYNEPGHSLLNRTENWPITFKKGQRAIELLLLELLSGIELLALAL